MGVGPFYACTTKHVPLKVFLPGCGKGEVPYENYGHLRKKTLKDNRKHIFKGGWGGGGVKPVQDILPMELTVK